MKLASAPGTTSPSKPLWELVLRASNAWSSQDPDGVASCYEEGASLTINRGTPARGRVELAATAAGYMAAFPDLQVSVDNVFVAGDSVFWIWTLTGTNSGPGGSGNRVRVSGIEVWTMGETGLVANSVGYYDAAAYELQIQHGIEE
ncbi:MAG: nuclear transport factor 2 family protein [Candidatus Dormibacteraeota bacterium]|nr:nuclear transport factor 2 family protein [Candidatus Dormibacteraeota bacterium]MBV9526368.1 nuclear transport factor 2 family protein [Candidatus Dormibacteraeota bacterium]